MLYKGQATTFIPFPPWNYSLKFYCLLSPPNYDFGFSPLITLLNTVLTNVEFSLPYNPATLAVPLTLCVCE